MKGGGTMKQILKYSTIAATVFAATPALAATLKLPTPPPTGTNQVVTASGVVDIITTAVNYLITLSTVLAVAMFIWGAVKYTGVLGGDGPKEGAPIMKNAAWALLAILGVGLLINSIAALLSRGLNLG